MGRCCFVPACTTGHVRYSNQQKSSGLKNKSLFKPPKNAELLAEWIRAIPRKGKVLSESCYVCELHFEDNDVLFYDETNLNDGTVNIVQRIRPILRTGAVPCIFPNQPLHVTKHKKKRKPPRDRSSFIDKNKAKLSPCCPVTSKSLCCPVTSEVQLSENIVQPFSFQYLKENFNQLEKPDSKWMFELKDDEVVLVRCSKRITISNGFIVKIFFSGIEILSDYIITTILSSMNEINKLLKYIHSLIECKGIMTTENLITRRSITCKGYVEKHLGQRGPMSNYCVDCRVARKRMADCLRQKVINLDKKIQEK